jgi:hypothetical protein
MAIDFTTEEKEILAFKAAWGAVDAMVNYEVLSLSHNDPDSEIRFNTPTHGKYFSIILLDFLHSKVFGIDRTCIQSLLDISQSPVLNEDVPF